MELVFDPGRCTIGTTRVEGMAAVAVDHEAKSAIAAYRVTLIARRPDGGEDPPLGTVVADNDRPPSEVEGVEGFHVYVEDRRSWGSGVPEHPVDLIVGEELGDRTIEEG